MKIAYNPKTAAALTTAPANNDITFDLSGLSIYVKGVRFKGTDTTYSVFKKHGSSGGGYDGLVPVPNYNNDSKTRFLREDGTWVIPTDSHYTTHLYVGAQSVSNNNNSNASTTNGNTYIKLFDNSTLRHQYLIKGSGNTTVNSDASGNITINSPTTISWGNVTEKPGSFTPATHYHNLLTNWPDTRAVATTPNDYNAVASNGGVFKVVGIKTAGTLGLTSTQVGSYATVIGWRGWNENSGGYAWEIASTDKNRLYVRSGSKTTWDNGWSAIAYTTDNFPTSQINKLTDYTIATSAAALATTDTLNVALGKLEYKLNIAYDLVTKANDKDGTIENLKEILDVLSGISDTETIKDIVGKYLPLAGGTMSGDISFKTIASWPTISGETYPINSKGIFWSGSSDNAKIFYRVKASDYGQQIFQLGDDTNGDWIFEFTTGQIAATINKNGITANGLINGNYFTSRVATGTQPYACTSTTLNTNLNADMLDGYHASGLVKFYLSPMTSNAPADSAKSWFINTMPSASGAIVYNVPGAEKTIIAGKSSGSYGHMLQLNYDDNYLRILRYHGGNWKTTDWEKISAGYADSAGLATKLTSSAGNATLPIYFSDGKPIVCTPASLFSNLSNDKNNLSITVAGQNRKLIVAYATNSDTVDGLHASDFKRTWDGYAGKTYIGWIKIIEWTLTIADHFSPYSFILQVYRNYNSPSPESYTLAFNFGWDSANIVQLNSNRGSRIIESFRVTKTADGLKYFVEMYVNTSYTTYQNTCYFAIGNYRFFNGSLVCAIQSETVTELCKITTSPNNIVAPGYVKQGSSDSYVLLGGGGHKTIDSFQTTYDDRYVKKAGDTLSSGTSQIQRAGSSVSWYQGRDNAMIRINSYSGYNAIASMKTTNGDWSLGVYSNNILYFTYFTDTNVSGKVNTPTTQIYMNPSGHLYATHFYESSDINLKTNIENINTADNMPILKSFDWKSDGTHSYGLIAQELEEQGYSELVETKEDGYKSVNYSAALSLIIGKLQVKIRELEKEIENLKNQN